MLSSFHVLDLQWEIILALHFSALQGPGSKYFKAPRELGRELIQSLATLSGLVCIFTFAFLKETEAPLCSMFSTIFLFLVWSWFLFHIPNPTGPNLWEKAVIVDEQAKHVGPEMLLLDTKAPLWLCDSQSPTSLSTEKGHTLCSRCFTRLNL